MSEKIDVTKLKGLSEFMSLINEVEEQSAEFMLGDMAQVLTQGDEDEPLCGAVDGYRLYFPPLVEVAQEAMERVSVEMEALVPVLLEAVEIFALCKREAIANCTKEGCPDRDEARRKLGWL